MPEAAARAALVTEQRENPMIDRFESDDGGYLNWVERHPYG